MQEATSRGIILRRRHLAVSLMGNDIPQNLPTAARPQSHSLGLRIMTSAIKSGFKLPAKASVPAGGTPALAGLPTQI